MKKMLLLCGALLALTASVASATSNQLTLAWNYCVSEGGLTNKTFVCTGTTAINSMICGYYSPVGGIPTMSGIEVFVDVASGAGQLPAWWSIYGTGACRQALSAQFAYTNNLAATVLCTDPWVGNGVGGIAAYTYGATISTIDAVGAVAPSQLMNIIDDGVTEYYACGLTIRGTGQTACAGCSTPACLRFRSALLTQPVGVGDFTITAGTNNFITANGPVTAGAGCPGATPTRNATWGQVKSLYR